jgi:hypothetical protein
MPFSFVHKRLVFAHPNQEISTLGGGYVLQICSQAYIILPIAFAHSSQEISTLEYPTGDGQSYSIRFRTCIKMEQDIQLRRIVDVPVSDFEISRLKPLNPHASF